MANDQFARKTGLHLSELLFENSWQDDIMRHRSQNAFRGVTTASFKLSTSLIRLGGPLHPDHGPKLEMSILRSFKKYAYTELDPRLQRLVLAESGAASRDADAPARLDGLAAGGASLRHLRF